MEEVAVHALLGGILFVVSAYLIWNVVRGVKAGVIHAPARGRDYRESDGALEFWFHVFGQLLFAAFFFWCALGVGLWPLMSR